MAVLEQWGGAARVPPASGFGCQKSGSAEEGLRTTEHPFPHRVGNHEGLEFGFVCLFVCSVGGRTQDLHTEL